MADRTNPVLVIAGKDIGDARRDSFVLVVTLFLIVAAMTALVVGAIALKTDVTTYNDAKAALLALGKSASVIAKPEFYPLKLLRGFIEHVEIIGAVIGILIGYRAAASERGRQTLALIMTRPVGRIQFLTGKLLGALVLIFAGLTGTFLLAGASASVLSGVVLTPDNMVRLVIVDLLATLYTFAFFLLGFIAALWARKLPNALMVAFTIWLSLVLIAPQIGDTMDPDNQVAGGVFARLHVTKAQEHEILSGFSTYETIRNGIEVASPTKHFERLAFAILGIKDIYTGQPLAPILVEKTSDIVWLASVAAALLLLLFARRIDPNRLSKE